MLCSRAFQCQSSSSISFVLDEVLWARKDANRWQSFWWQFARTVVVGLPLYNSRVSQTCNSQNVSADVLDMHRAGYHGHGFVDSSFTVVFGSSQNSIRLCAPPYRPVETRAARHPRGIHRRKPSFAGLDPSELHERETEGRTRARLA